MDDKYLYYIFEKKSEEELPLVLKLEKRDFRFLNIFQPSNSFLFTLILETLSLVIDSNFQKKFWDSSLLN